MKLPVLEEPMTKAKYNAIWMITDLLIKYMHFLPYKESSTVEELSYTFQKEVVVRYGIPEVIISDRGLAYTSKFW